MREKLRTWAIALRKCIVSTLVLVGVLLSFTSPASPREYCVEGLPSSFIQDTVKLGPLVASAPADTISHLSNSSPSRLKDTLSLPQQDATLRLPSADSLGLPAISPSLSTSETDTTSSEEPIVLEDVVTFAAQDSMVVLGQNEVFFFGKGKVKYRETNLSASYMKMRIDSAQVYAQYVLDSLGHPADFPVFTDGKQSFETETMLYNYNTEKGYTTGILTQQSGGYLTSKQSKRIPDNTMFIQEGIFTTCDNVNCPHFGIHMTRAKVTPDDNIVTGPVYLVMGGVPLYPIGLPFGFFPFNEKRTSGLIFPSYGEELERGLYFRGMGFYFAFSDYVDLTVRGDIYTRGSWGVYAESNYIKRYKYSGSASISFVSTKRGYKSVPGDYSASRDFSVNWSHRQDSKVDPLRTFSASVNFSTSSYNHNSLETMYDPNKRAQNTKGSSISYSRRFTTLPLNVTAAFTIDQRSRDSTISVTLPNVSLSLSTIYPLKRKKALGKERWYEKISLSYSGNLKNSIITKEDKLLQSNLVRDWRNGMDHNIPISASFDLFNYIKLTPSFNYQARWVTNKVYQEWDAESQHPIARDTVYGFNHLHEFNASLSLSTTLYGFFRPWKIFGDKVQMIRHRFTPSISVSYRPDFGTPFWGYYETLHYTDREGVEREHIYSPFERGLYSPPGRGKSGLISMGFNNNLEMKVRSEGDTINDGTKKISLIDQFDWRLSYNMAADSFKWSNIGATLALRFSPSVVLRLSGDFDTYLYDYSLSADGKPIPRRIDKLRIMGGKGLGRLISTGTSFSYTLNNQTVDKINAFFGGLFKKRGEELSSSKGADNVAKPPGRGAIPSSDSVQGDFPGSGKPPLSGPLPSRSNYNRPPEMGELDDDGYVKWNFPWNLSVNYSMNVGYNTSKFNIETREYDYSLQHNLSLRGDFQPTQNWRFSFDANYNFALKRITNMTISVYRSLHCWELSANIIPIGAYKSYSITIGVAAEMLKDVKYQQSNLSSSGGSWY